MQRRIARNIRYIRGKRSYTLREISILLKVNIRTTQAWHREGLRPIDPDDRPMLFLGADIKKFLTKRRDSHKIKLLPGQFYCPKCRAARNPRPGSVTFTPTGRRIGLDDEQVFIKGICSKCGCRLTRFTTKSRLQATIFPEKIEQVEMRLYSDEQLRSNTDMKQGGQ